MASERLSHATIIAGGLGTRAHGLTSDRIPKALLPVAGVPIVFRQMEVLARGGIREVTVLAGHLGDQLAAALAPMAERLSLSLSVVVEKEPLGTAGCLTALKPLGHDSLIVYGDMLFDVDLDRLAAVHEARQGLLTVVAHPNDHPDTSDLLVARGGVVRAVFPVKAPRPADLRNLVPAGLYLATPAFLETLAPARKADMIHDVLPALLAGGKKIAAYNTPEYLRDVGTPIRHALAEADIESGRVGRESLRRKQRAIFFDIDGTLSIDPGGHGVLSPDQVALYPEAAPALRRAREAGFLTVAVTNRPQLAKGLLDYDGLERIFGRLEGLLARQGAWFSRIYFCPHHPEKGFAGEVEALKMDCPCRKPHPGMLEEAAADLNIDLRSSAIIGDSLRDIGAARAMGIEGFGVRTGYGCRDRDRYPGPPPEPDAMFDTVLAATDDIIARHKADLK